MSRLACVSRQNCPGAPSIDVSRARLNLRRLTSFEKTLRIPRIRLDTLVERTAMPKIYTNATRLSRYTATWQLRGVCASRSEWLDATLGKRRNLERGVRKRREMFEKASLWAKFRSLGASKFEADNLSRQLQEVFGADTMLGSARI